MQEGHRHCLHLPLADPTIEWESAGFVQELLLSRSEDEEGQEETLEQHLEVAEVEPLNCQHSKPKLPGHHHFHEGEIPRSPA